VVVVPAPGVGDVTAGGGVVGDTCAGAGALGCIGAGVVLAVPVGAGAAAWVVAGRLAQPLPTTATTSSDVTTRNEPRVTMTPPFDLSSVARCNA
jgi:hypothetical protein